MMSSPLKKSSGQGKHGGPGDTPEGGAAARPSHLSLAFSGNVADVIHSMRSGVKANLVPVIAERFGLSQDKLFEQLRLPRSTMKGRVGKNEVLSASEQDRMYRADKLWSRALAVLEDESAARTWINRSNRSLGGEAPLTLLDTEAGYELVLDTLTRIEYGVVS
jgi:putative toxin-antitoxin system antitoxin component (TIGR02293 family)